MSSPQDVKDIVVSALALLPPSFTSPAAVTMLVAISGQEAGYTARYQVLSSGNKGPARGLWQFERGGGVAGVMTHRSSKAHAIALCKHFNVVFDDRAIWTALETNDQLAACFARLLLITDPRPLPPPHPFNEQAAWDTYLRNWRPGKPHRNRWGAHWIKACL